jgi:hypothetical protein
MTQKRWNNLIFLFSFFKKNLDFFPQPSYNYIIQTKQQGKPDMKELDLSIRLHLAYTTLLELKAMSTITPDSADYGDLGGVKELVEIMTKLPLPEGYEKIVARHRDMYEMDCAQYFKYAGYFFAYNVDNGLLVMEFDNEVTMSITFTLEGVTAVMEGNCAVY